MVVSKLTATVGSDTENIRLAVPAKKLPSAALISSSQLMRESMCCRFGIAGRVNQRGGGPQASCRLPMFLNQLDTKLKGSFDFRLGNLRFIVRPSAKICYFLKPHGLHPLDQLIFHRIDQERRQGLRRPRRTLQTGFEPVFDRLIAQHDHIAARKIAARPAAQCPAKSSNRSTFRRMMAFDSLLFDEIGIDELSVERHGNGYFTRLC